MISFLRNFVLKKTLAKIFGYIFSRKALHDLSSISAIGAFALGFYALINPGSVSGYLDKVVDNSSLSNLLLDKISTDASGISQNTDRLAAEIPEQIDFVEAYNFSDTYTGKIENVIVLQNTSNSIFADIQVRFFSSHEAKLINEKLGHIAVADMLPRSITKVVLPSKLGIFIGGYCLVANNTRNNEKYFEFRELTFDFSDYSKQVGFNTVRVVSSNEQPPQECR